MCSISEFELKFRLHRSLWFNYTLFDSPSANMLECLNNLPFVAHSKLLRLRRRTPWLRRVWTCPPIFPFGQHYGPNMWWETTPFASLHSALRTQADITILGAHYSILHSRGWRSVTLWSYGWVLIGDLERRRVEFALEKLFELTWTLLCCSQEFWLELSRNPISWLHFLILSHPFRLSVDNSTIDDKDMYRRRMLQGKFFEVECSRRGRSCLWRRR